MEKILVSACLLGDKTRYDGKDNYFPFLEKLRKYYDLVPFCPELSSGLSIPRKKAEIKKGRVINEDGDDLTSIYQEAAEHCLRICQYYGIRYAILKDRSPACGSRKIHDGSFTSNVIDGLGVTAERLIQKGIKVFAETDALEFLLPKEDVKKDSNGKYKTYNKIDKEKKPYSKSSTITKKSPTSSKKETGQQKTYNSKKTSSYKKKDTSSKSTSYQGKNTSSSKKPYVKKSDSLTKKKSSSSKQTNSKSSSYKKRETSSSKNYKSPNRSSKKPSYKK